MDSSVKKLTEQSMTFTFAHQACTWQLSESSLYGVALSSLNVTSYFKLLQGFNTKQLMVRERSQALG